ncbi:hypothetical protein IAT38_001397 [Cryptococcus sp. DSM 104549]
MSENAEAGPSNPSRSLSRSLSRSHSPSPPPQSQWYLHHLDAHILSSFRAYTGSHPSSLATTPIPPSHALWSTAEKSRFFAALARYSRWRPDLIAQEVGKAPVEVGWYLEYLEAGRLESATAEWTVRNQGEGNKVGVGRRWLPGMALGAREVSDEWVGKEETLAEGLRVGLEEREREDNERELKKRRRIEKREVNGDVVEDGKAKDKGKGKAREVDDAKLQELERRWALEDWLSELSSSKLLSLDLILDLPPLPLPLSLAASRASPLSPSSPSAPQPPKHDPNNKIARDRLDRDRISAIPKRSRTPEQRKRLSQILNRQSNRERYRTKKLVEEGWTVEAIKERGGADVIFAEREAGLLDKEGEGDEEADEGDPTAEPGKGRRKRKQRDAAEEDKLRGMGMEEYLTGNGLELFNYVYMTKIMRPPLTPPNLSATILSHLHTELLIFLKPLIYGAIVVAEQAAAQGPDESAGGDTGSKNGQADADGEDDGARGPSMSKEHVHQVMALSGGSHPFGIIEEVLERVWAGNEEADGEDEEEDEEGEEEVGEDGGTVGQNGDKENGPKSEGEGPSSALALGSRPRPRASYHKDVFPPTSAPWEALSTLPIAPSSSTAHAPTATPSRPGAPLSSLSQHPPLYANSEPTSDSESHLPDDEVILEAEDEALDAALDALDASHDKAYEVSLWATLESDDPKAELVDGDDAWLPRTESKLEKGLRARTEVENAYMTLLAQTEKARRSRAAKRQREARGRGKAGAGRKIKSAAIIEDSGSDMEVDEDEVVGPDEPESEAELDADAGDDEGDEEDAE